jgi:hypothetical protein
VSVLTRVFLVWVVAVIAISIGMLGTGVHLFATNTFSESSRFWAGIIGWPCAVVGPCLGIMGILWVLTSEDRRLEVHRKALVWCDRKSDHKVPWQELDDVTVTGSWPRRSLQLHTSDGSTFLLPGSWLGTSAKQLAGRLLEVRRRVLLGVPDVLPPPGRQG